MNLATLALATLTLAASTFGCDPGPSDDDGSMSGDSGSETGGSETEGPVGECIDGYELLDEDECPADAGCYALPDGALCIGECPAGEQLDLSGDPMCVVIDIEPGCAEGYSPIASQQECLADAGCYELPDGSWCTGACPAGQGLDDSVPPQCVDVPFGGCLEGFELVRAEIDCLADATCYEVPPYGWCTGECPDGGEFTQTEAGPACI